MRRGGINADRCNRCAIDLCYGCHAADDPRECLWGRAFAGLALGLGSADVGPEENKPVR